MTQSMINGEIQQPQYNLFILANVYG